MESMSKTLTRAYRRLWGKDCTVPKIVTGVVIYLLNTLLVGFVIGMFRQDEPYAHQSHSLAGLLEAALGFA